MGRGSSWKAAVGPALLLALVACGDAGGGGGGLGGTPDGGGGGSTPDDGGGGGAACPDGYDECDGNPGSACETSLLADPLHCGDCDTTCPDGPNQVPVCQRGTCALACANGFADCDDDTENGCEHTSSSCEVTTVASDVDSPTGLEVDDEWVYFGSRGHENVTFDDGAVFRAPKAGGATVTIASAQVKPLNLTIDDAYVYWGARGHDGESDGTVVRALKTAVDGDDVEIIQDGQAGPGNVIVDDVNIYWTTRDDDTTGLGRIMKAAKDGSDGNVATEVAIELYDARDLQLYDKALYWVTGGAASLSAPLIVRYPLPDGPAETITDGIAKSSWHNAIDDDAFYVGSFETQTVSRVRLDTGAATTIGNTFGNPNELVLDGAGGTVYVTTSGGGQVLAIPKNGGNPIVIADELTYPSYITQDAGYVYFTDGFLSNPGGQIKRAAKLR